MDNGNEMRDLLTSRRAKITPDQAGLEGIARALQLDEAERAHLFDLARAAEPGTPSDDALKLLESWAATPSAADSGRGHTA